MIDRGIAPVGRVTRIVEQAARAGEDIQVVDMHPEDVFLREGNVRRFTSGCRTGCLTEVQ